MLLVGRVRLRTRHILVGGRRPRLPLIERTRKPIKPCRLRQAQPDLIGSVVSRVDTVFHVNVPMAGLKGFLVIRTALAMVRSFLMHATRASFLGFPQPQIFW